MDLRHLRYFLEMVEHGSLSMAAQRLNVAQSALSFHLKNMELNLGTTLLLRKSGGVVPTEAGEALARHARLMLQEQDRGLTEIRAMGRDPAGEVRLGLPGTVSEMLTVPLIEAALRRLPNVRLTVSEAMSGFVANWMRDGQIDLGVLYQDPGESGLHAEHLLDEELVLIAAPRHPGRDAASFALLGGHPLILPSRVHGLRRMLEVVSGRCQQKLSPVIEIDSYKNIKVLVARGIGVSILPRHAVEAERVAGQLVTQAFEGPGLWRQLYLVHRSARPKTRATQAVQDLVREITLTLATGDAWAGARVAITSPVSRPG